MAAVFKNIRQLLICWTFFVLNIAKVNICKWLHNMNGYSIQFFIHSSVYITMFKLVLKQGNLSFFNKLNFFIL